MLVQYDYVHDLHWCSIYVNWAIAQAMLEENYQTNLILIQSWFDSGFLSADQLTEYRQLGDVIKGFSFGPAISTPSAVPGVHHK